MAQGGTVRSSQEDSGIAALMRLLIIPQRRNNPKYMGLRTSQKRPWWNVSVSCQHLARTPDHSVHAPSLTKGRAVTLKFLPHHYASFSLPTLAALLQSSVFSGAMLLPPRLSGFKPPPASSTQHGHHYRVWLPWTLPLTPHYTSQQLKPKKSLNLPTSLFTIRLSAWVWLSWGRHLQHKIPSLLPSADVCLS